jgi:hypothetical protein
VGGLLERSDSHARPRFTATIRRVHAFTRRLAKREFTYIATSTIPSTELVFHENSNDTPLVRML